MDPKNLRFTRPSGPKRVIFTNSGLGYYSKTAQPSTYATVALWDISRVYDLLYLVVKLLKCCSNILRSLKHWSQSSKSHLLIIVGVFMKKKCQMFPIVKIFEVITVDFDAQFWKNVNFRDLWNVFEILPTGNCMSKSKMMKRHQGLLERLSDCSPTKDVIKNPLCTNDSEGSSFSIPVLRSVQFLLISSH